MKISIKRNIAFGLVLTLITFVVLYSHCNGNSVCYTFPFLNGQNQPVATKQVLMTVSTPNGGRVFIENIDVNGKYHDSDSVFPVKPETKGKESDVTASTFQESPDNPAEETGEESSMMNEEPLTVGSTREGQSMSHVSTPTLNAPKRLEPPSDITGAVAEEILRKANISREEANRSLVRVERIDRALEDVLDREKKIHFRHAQHSDEHEKELIREKRVDPTEEDEITRKLEEAEQKSEQQNMGLFHDALLKRANSGESPVIVHPGEDGKDVTNMGLKESQSLNLGQIIKEIQDSYSYDGEHSGNVLSQEKPARGLNTASFSDIGSVLFNLSRVLKEITASNNKDNQLDLIGSGSGKKIDRQVSDRSGGNAPRFVIDPYKETTALTSPSFNPAGNKKSFRNLDLSSERTQEKHDSLEEIDSKASKKILFNPARTKDERLTEEDKDLTRNPKMVEKDKLTSIRIGSEKHLEDGTWARMRTNGPGRVQRVDSSATDKPSSSLKKVSSKTTGKGRRSLLSFDQVGCNPLDPHVLLFNRIFKTGSSTTEFLIKKSSQVMNYDYHTGTTEDWYENGKHSSYSTLIKHKIKDNLKCKPRMAFIGHFYFRGKMSIPQAHTYINQVREPVRRVVSHYYYMRSKIRPPRRLRMFLKSGVKNDTLQECFRLQHKGCQNNVMTKFFCGKHYYCGTGSRKALQKAKANIRRHYAAVGILQYYPSYLQILSKRLPKFFPKVTVNQIRIMKRNRDYRFDKVPVELLEAIKKANWADQELYSFIKQRFFKQARACGIQITESNLGQTR